MSSIDLTTLWIFGSMAAIAESAEDSSSIVDMVLLIVLFKPSVFMSKSLMEEKVSEIFWIELSSLVADWFNFVKLSEKLYAKLESVNPGGSIKDRIF